MVDALMDILKDKTKILKFLLSTLDETTKERDGLTKLSESLTRQDPNLKPENMAKCLATTMSVVAKQSHREMNLAIIALITVQSSSFDSDVALLLNKLGKGNEALQQMLKAKLAGK
jgi:hypothetical protein